VPKQGRKEGGVVGDQAYPSCAPCRRQGPEQVRRETKGRPWPTSRSDSATTTEQNTRGKEHQLRNTRRKLSFAGSVTAIVLVLASAAFACTTFKGKFNVTAGPGTSTAFGANSGMKHCPPPNDPKSVAEVPTSGGTIQVEAFPTGTNTTDCPSSQLSASKTTMPFPRRYYIYYVNQNGFVDNGGVWKWSVDCMAGSGTKLSTSETGKSDEIWINSNGRSTTGDSTSPEGPRYYTVPGGQAASSATDRAGVCISDTGAGQGNQTPLRIVSI
jgi:hypothetical protein